MAKLLGFAPETVYRKVKAGEIPAIRLGGSIRFPASLLDGWIDSRGKGSPRRWRSHLDRFVELLREKWGPDLKSVVLFGSYATGRERPESDIDILIVCDRFPPSRLERQRMVFDLAKKITSAFARKLSPVPQTSAEAIETRPLYLGILAAYEILLDSGRFFQRRLRKVKTDLENASAERMTDKEGGVYWVFPRPEAPEEAV